VRRPAPKKTRRAGSLSARLVDYVTLDVRADGSIAAGVGDHAIGLGKVSADAAKRAQRLRTGLRLDTVLPRAGNGDNELLPLMRRLAGHGLLEYRLGHGDEDEVVIEPQVPDYWPRLQPLDPADVLVLSRFAYMRRRGNEMVLESPRAGALFRICNPAVAAAMATLSRPQSITALRRQSGFPGKELLGVLTDCQILFKVEPGPDAGLRPTEGDDDLVLWDFHDLLFHARSTEGRHANPTGGVYPYVGVMAPLPAVRAPWPGDKIDLRAIPDAQQAAPVAKLLRERHSTRAFDDQRPITLAELARFLDGAARVQANFTSRLDLDDDDSPEIAYAARPYPSGGGSWELELYLAVDRCDGLARGFYHYDAGEHALVSLDVCTPELDAMLAGAEFAMGASAAPQVLITIAARFGRVSWKYSSLAYALVLKDAGVLIQTLYLMATDLGLGGCAIGSVNNDLFARMTGLAFHVEGPVGQFALGRGGEPEATG